jgi:DNA/RNA-binding domain of Phe-tRNA-synthetase-like protein
MRGSLLFVADSGVLSSRHIYNAWESIFAVFGRSKQHAGSSSDHLCKPDLAG